MIALLKEEVDGLRKREVADFDWVDEVTWKICINFWLKTCIDNLFSWYNEYLDLLEVFFTQDVADNPVDLIKIIRLLALTRCIKYTLLTVKLISISCVEPILSLVYDDKQLFLRNLIQEHFHRLIY